MDPIKMKLLQKIAAEASKGIPQQYRPEAPQVPDLPSLPNSLNQQEQWISALWMIEYAEKYGRAALTGLAVAYGKIIQAEHLKIMLMDARQFSEGRSDISSMLWDADIVLTDKGDTLTTLLKLVRQHQSVQLRESIVLSAPWRRDRLIRSLDNLRDQDWRQDSNHHADIWYPWPILWVANGCHSTAVGALYGKGEFSTGHQYDATRLLRAVQPDGQHWRRACDGSVIDTISSVPMAAIFEIGRRLINIKPPDDVAIGESLPDSGPTE